MVFWGKAKSIKSRGAQDRVEFEITELYKGDEREAVSVYTNRFHHDCGIRFEVDKTYMVYAYDFYPRGVATSMCWGTYPAEEAVGEDEWTKLEVKVPEDTEFEEKLREIGKELVQKCGAKNRVYDAGFSMIASPGGDPVRPQVKRTRARAKLQGFRDCVTDAFMEHEDLPRPEEAIQLEGWYQREIRSLPVLLDQLPCGEDCETWEKRVKAALLRTALPDSDDQQTVNLRNEYNQCVSGGISAIGGESHGSPGFQQARDRMLADCAAARGEFGHVEPYLEQVNNLTLRGALKWGIKTAPPSKDQPAQPTVAADAGSADAGVKGPALGAGSTGAGRAAEVYPLNKAGELGYVRAALGEEPKVGDFRVKRAAFLDDEVWYQSPLYLEAFAQLIVADESSTPIMRDLASLAYHRASKFVPGAAEDYGRLADEASSSEEATAMRAELDKAWTAAFAPPPEVAEEVAVQEVAPVAQEAPEEDRNMLLVVAGVLIVIALLGIGVILKRRS